MWISAPLRVTWTAAADAAPGAGDNVKGAEAPGPATVANPIHLMEPSGQYASGQLWSGRLFPCAVASEKD